MIRSFVNLRAVDLGFDARGWSALGLAANGILRDPERQRAFSTRGGQRIAATPGVQTVSFATSRPFACCAPSSVST